MGNVDQMARRVLGLASDSVARRLDFVELVLISVLKVARKPPQTVVSPLISRHLLESAARMAVLYARVAPLSKCYCLT